MRRLATGFPKSIRPMLCCVLLVTAFAFVLTRTPSPRPFGAGEQVQVWLTTPDLTSHLTPQANLAFASDAGTFNPLTVTVNENQTFQQMDGFGAAMTDTSAWLISSKLTTTQRAALMSNLFDSTSGIGVNYVRVPMGSSDFTATPPSAPAPYSYDDLPAGQTDPTLANFSISHDLTYIIPTLQQALQIQPNAKVLATPWSPPGWMKTSGSMIGGSLSSSNNYGPLAQYFVKFVQAYQTQGVPVYAVAPQNEPDYVPPDYPGMSFPPADEATFVQNNLAPALSSANLHTKILAADESNWSASYPQTVLGNSGAANAIAGIAYHCYGGDPSVMTQVHNAYPTKDASVTECSTGSSGIAPLSAIDLAIRGSQNWAKSILLWNIALDTNDGPHIGCGCNNCTGLVSIDQATGNVTYLNNYYQLGHVSKFVVPGAYHIASNTFGADSVEDVAFKNPDGSKVLVAHNSSSASQSFKVLWGTESFTYTLPAGGIATFTWAGTPAYGSTYALNAGGASATNFSADGYFNGGETYTTTATINTGSISNPAPQAVY